MRVPLKGGRALACRRCCLGSAPADSAVARSGCRSARSPAAELETGDPTDHDVLAQLGDGFVQQVLDRLAWIANVLLIEQRHVTFAAVLRWLGAADAARVRGGDLHGDLARERLEVVRACDEVGFAVDLNHGADAPGVDVAVDQALAGLTAG